MWKLTSKNKICNPLPCLSKICILNARLENYVILWNWLLSNNILYFHYIWNHRVLFYWIWNYDTKIIFFTNPLLLSYELCGFSYSYIPWKMLKQIYNIRYRMSGMVIPSAEGIATAVVVITTAAAIILLARLRRTPAKSTSVLPSPREAAVPHEQFRSCAPCRHTSRSSSVYSLAESSS